MVSSMRSLPPPSPPPRTSKMPKSFLDLPAEIRNAIYEGTLPKTKSVYIRNGQIIIHPLLLVSRQIRHEYHPFHEAHVDAAEWVEADVTNWDFRHVNKFFDTTQFHQLGDMPKLKIHLVLDNPVVAFDQGCAGAAFHHWFSKPYRVRYIVPCGWFNPYSGGNLFSNGSSSQFSGGGSSNLSGRSSLFSNGGSPPFSNARPTTFATAGSSFLPNGGGSLLYSNGGNTQFSNGAPALFATAGSPMLPNGGGSLLYSNGGNLSYSNGGGPSLLSGSGSTRFSNNRGTDLITNYDLQVDWNKYDTTSLERLLDQIEDWFRRQGIPRLDPAIRLSAGWGLINAMRQTLRSRREWTYLETYRAFLTNSKPTRWPGIDDGIENDVDMMDAS